MTILLNKNFRLSGFISVLLVSLLLATNICLTGCSDSENELSRDINHLQLPDHSLLIYLVADNNLSYQCETSFKQITEAYFGTKGHENTNLFIYVDNIDADPVLYWLDPVDGITILRNYNETDSCSPSVIKDVCTTAFGSGSRNNPVNTAIFWSHGTNWLPATHTGSRSFGDDDGRQVDIADMADALKGLNINNLMFDACQMASVEVAAQFADAADVLVGSPAEILATSFPYHTIIPDLCTSNPDMHKVVDRFFEYYDSMQGQYRSGILTAVNLSGIRRLAHAFGKIKNPVYGDRHLQSVPILCYDRYNPKVFYDFMQFGEMCRDKYAELYDKGQAEELFKELEKAFNECDIYTRDTGRVLEIKLTNPCGLSVYVPGPITVKGLDYFYAKLAWYDWTEQATGEKTGVSF